MRLFHPDGTEPYRTLVNDLKKFSETRALEVNPKVRLQQIEKLEQDDITFINGLKDATDINGVIDENLRGQMYRLAMETRAYLIKKREQEREAIQRSTGTRPPANEVISPLLIQLRKYAEYALEQYVNWRLSEQNYPYYKAANYIRECYNDNKEPDRSEIKKKVEHALNHMPDNRFKGLESKIIQIDNKVYQLALSKMRVSFEEDGNWVKITANKSQMKLKDNARISKLFIPFEHKERRMLDELQRFVQAVDEMCVQLSRLRNIHIEVLLPKSFQALTHSPASIVITFNNKKERDSINTLITGIFKGKAIHLSNHGRFSVERYVRNETLDFESELATKVSNEILNYENIAHIKPREIANRINTIVLSHLKYPSS